MNSDINVHKDTNDKSAVDLEIESLQATEQSLKQSIAARTANPNSVAKVTNEERGRLRQVQARLAEIQPKAPEEVAPETESKKK